MLSVCQALISMPEISGCKTTVTFSEKVNLEVLLSYRLEERMFQKP